MYFLYKYKEKRMKLPFILILDIDNTVIGEITHCLKEHKLLDIIYKNCISIKNLPSKCAKSDILDMQDELKEGLLRPNVKDFLNFFSKKFKNVEVFFYTNSTYNWANTVLVREIEKALDYKVNRPIFTREDSLSNLEKTISAIYPQIFKSLIKKYPLLENDKHINTVFNERMIFIDDIAENVHDYKSRQIKCPEYSYHNYYDIYEKIINKYKIPDEVFDNEEILNYMNETPGLPIYHKNGSIYQQDKNFVYLEHLYQSKHWEIHNTLPSKDTFFLDLIKALEKVDKCTDKEIEKINKIFA